MRTSKRSCSYAGALLAVAGLFGTVAACQSPEDAAGTGGASNETTPDGGTTAAGGSGAAEAGASAGGGRTGGAGASGGPGETATGGSGGPTTGTGGIASIGGTTGTGGVPSGTGGGASGGGSGGGGRIKYVFVIAMENESAAAIYGSASAPYINAQLLPGARDRVRRSAARCDPQRAALRLDGGGHQRVLRHDLHRRRRSVGAATAPSRPRTSSTQMNAAIAAGELDGLPGGARTARPAPARSARRASTPPSTIRSSSSRTSPAARRRRSNAACAAHHRRTRRPPSPGAGQRDGRPVQLHRPQRLQRHARRFGLPVVQRDRARATPGSPANLPPIIDFVNAHEGVIFIVWDEPEGGSTLIPFVADRPAASRPATRARCAYTHSSLMKIGRGDLRPAGPADGGQRQRLRRSVPARSAIESPRWGSRADAPPAGVNVVVDQGLPTKVVTLERR